MTARFNYGGLWRVWILCQVFFLLITLVRKYGKTFHTLHTLHVLDLAIIRKPKYIGMAHAPMMMVLANKIAAADASASY